MGCSLTFALEKTQAMVEWQAMAAMVERLFFGGDALPLQDEVKILGVEVDQGLKYHNHWQRISALRKVVGYLDRKKRQQLYKAQARPFLEHAVLSNFAFLSWWMLSPQLMKEPECPLDTLEHRRDVVAIVVFHKA